MLLSSLSKCTYLRLTQFLVVLFTLSSCLSISVSVNWTTIIGFTILAGTYLIAFSLKTPEPVVNSSNPYKGKKGKGFLTKEAEARTNQLIADLVVYNAGAVKSLKRFDVIKCKTECMFAKRSRLWGSMDYDQTLSLERNIERLIPTFYKFTLAFQDLGLDAFLVELPASPYGTDIETFSDAVRRVLLTLRTADIQRQTQQLREQSTRLDPTYVENKMRFLKPEDTRRWDRPSWVFEFNKVTFFLTSFAPFYPETNSRYSFGADHCYILFQPEISFAIHDLPPDVAETNWDCPVTVRDKIRVAFREAGREYQPPLVTRLPMVYDIVKPIDPYDSPTQWWNIS